MKRLKSVQCRACSADNDAGVSACQICGETAFFSLPFGSVAQRRPPSNEDSGLTNPVPLSPKSEALLERRGNCGEDDDAHHEDASKLAYSPPPVPVRPGRGEVQRLQLLVDASHETILLLRRTSSSSFPSFPLAHMKCVMDLLVESRKRVQGNLQYGLRKFNGFRCKLPAKARAKKSTGSGATKRPASTTLVRLRAREIRKCRSEAAFESPVPKDEVTGQKTTTLMQPTALIIGPARS